MKTWQKHTVLELRAELRKANLKVSGRKSDLVARITKSNATFKLFPKLPSELRVAIWKAAIPRIRLQEVRLTQKSLYFMEDNTGLEYLIHTCRESRGIMTDVAQNRIAKSGNQPVRVNPSLEANSFFDGSRDTLYFSTSKRGLKLAPRHVLERLGEKACNFERVVFLFSHVLDIFICGHGHNNYYLDRLVYHFLSRLKNLREIWFVRDGPPSEQPVEYHPNRYNPFHMSFHAVQLSLLWAEHEGAEVEALRNVKIYAKNPGLDTWDPIACSGEYGLEGSDSC